MRHCLSLSAILEVMMIYLKYVDGGAIIHPIHPGWFYHLIVYKSFKGFFNLRVKPFSPELMSKYIELELFN